MQAFTSITGGGGCEGPFSLKTARDTSSALGTWPGGNSISAETFLSHSVTLPHFRFDLGLLGRRRRHRWVFNALNAKCPAIEILTSEGPIDTERRPRPLAGRDYGKLHILDHVPCCKHAGDARGFILTTPDTPTAIELTPQGHREF